MNDEILSFYTNNKQWLYALSEVDSDLIRSLAMAVIETAELEIKKKVEE